MLMLSKATLPEHSTLGNMQISFNPFLFCLFSNPYSVKRLFDFYSLIYFIHQQCKLFTLTLSLLQTLSIMPPCLQFSLITGEGQTEVSH